MLKRLTSWLRHSSHVHTRQAEVSNLSELVALLDRFLDDRLQHPLEWDDFVSWESEAPAIESIRRRIAATEPLFSSGRAGDVAKGSAVLHEERNRAAALVGQPARTLNSPGAA